MTSSTEYLAQLSVRKRLEQEIFECEGRAVAYGWLSDAEEKARHLDEDRRNTAELRRLEQELDRILVAEERAARRAPIAAVLLPRTRDQVVRPFIWDAAQHLIDLAVEHNITVVREVRADMSATVRSRLVRCAPALTEDVIATVLHEFGHAVEPRADGQQFRHVLGGKASIISPRAECAAWLWAVGHTYRDHHGDEIWTPAMHETLERSIDTYWEHATAEERQAISATVTFSRGQIRDASDSREGRQRTVDRIAAEWIPSADLQARIRRVAEIQAEDQHR